LKTDIRTHCRNLGLALLSTWVLSVSAQATETYRYPPNVCGASGYYPAAAGACTAGANAMVACGNKWVPAAVRTLTSATLTGMTCNAVYHGVQVSNNSNFDDTFSFTVAEELPRPEADSCNCGKDGMGTAKPINPATGEKALDDQGYAGGGPDALSLLLSYRSGRVVGALTGSAGAGLGQAWSHNHRVYLRLEGEAGTPGHTANLYFGDDTVRIFGWNTSSSAWLPANGVDTLAASSGGFLYKRQEDDSAWQFDATGKLLTMTRRNGWVTTYAYSTGTTSSAIAPVPGLLIAVHNHFGRSLDFAYNAASQLVSVTANGDQVASYTYDGTAETSRLTAVSYPGNAGGSVSKTYLYENTAFPQLVTGINDEAGNRLTTIAYDSQGRATSSGNALGADLYSVSYATAGDAVVTDPQGTVRTYHYGTNAGRLAVTGADKPSDTGANSAASRVQDANGLVMQETDFLGVITTYTWDIDRRLPLTTTQAAALPEARTTTTQWHSTFRLPVLVTEAGRTTAYTYDTQGNTLSQTVTDTATNVARTTSWTYNPQGQVATQTTNGVVSQTYAYYGATSFSGTAPSEVGHTAGDLQSITNAAGHVTQFTLYDRAGRVKQMVDPKGVVTDMTYTPRGWVSGTSVTPPGGTARTTSYTYDNAGQLTGVTLPDSSTMSYSYDAAHRLTGVTDAKGNTVAYTLDAMSNKVGEQVKDSSGNLQRNITRVYDAMNRVQQTTGASN